MLDQELVNSRTEIADRYGLSRARVTQLMKLLALPVEVRKYLLSLDDAKEIRRVSERKLRPLLGQQHTEAGEAALQQLLSDA